MKLTDKDYGLIYMCISEILSNSDKTKSLSSEGMKELISLGERLESKLKVVR